MMEKKRFSIFQEFEKGYFSPAYSFTDTLKGLFQLEYFEMEGRYALFPREMKLDGEDLIDIPSPEVQEINSEVTGYFEKYDELKRLGLPRTRGLLITGPPGTGKSKCLERIAVSVVEKYSAVVFDLYDEQQLTYYAHFFNSQFRQICPQVRVLTVVEDCERFTGNQAMMSLLLNLLSGVGTTEHLFIGTSNYPAKLDERLLRPGRFDRRIRIGLPTAELRQNYFTRIFQKADKPMQDMTDLITKTEGFSLAQLREFAVSLLVYGKSVSDTAQLLNELAKHPTAEPGNRNKIGF